MSLKMIVYGANGHTGRLVAETAIKAGFAVTVAGRTATRVIDVANRLRRPWFAAPVDDHRTLVRYFRDSDVVVNAAGPYRETAMAVARACHEAGCAYVDLCGEVDVLSNLVGASDLVSPKRSILVGAGFTPVASVLVLDYLHFYTPPDDDAAPRHVHVGYTAPPRLTKGSLSTVFGTSGGSVTTFRRGFAHCIPAGSHERVFAFFGSRRLCSAISMADPWAIIDWSSRLEPIQAVDPQAFLEATRLRAHARDQTDLRLVSQGEIGRFILRAGLATQLQGRAAQLIDALRKASARQSHLEPERLNSFQAAATDALRSIRSPRAFASRLCSPGNLYLVSLLFSSLARQEIGSILMNVFGYHTPLGMASRERLKAFAEHAREDGDWQATAPHAVQALRDALRPLAQFLPQPSGKRITDAALALWHEVLRDDVAPGAFLDDEEGWGRFLARVQTLLEAIRDAGQPSLQAPPASTEGDDPALSASAFIEMAPMSSGAYQAANWAASLAPWAARSVGAGWMSSLAMFDGRDAFVVDSGKDGDALCLRVECMDRYQRVRWGEVRVHDYYRWSAIAAVEAANIAGASNPLREPASAASVLIRRAWSWEAFKGAHWRFSDGHESPEHF